MSNLESQVVSISESPYGGPVFTVTEVRSIDLHAKEVEFRFEVYHQIDGEDWFSEVECVATYSGDESSDDLKRFVDDMTRRVVQDAYTQAHTGTDEEPNAPGDTDE